MPTQLDLRQSELRTALSMVGSAANASADSLFLLIDAQLAKLFEDRNTLLTDGGIVTFTGTQVQFTESLKLSVNSKVSGVAPQVFDLAATTRTLSVSGRMIYAVINRTAGTATVTDDAATLPAVTSANQEVFLIAKRVDAADGTQRLYFRNGSGLNAGQSVRLGASGSGSGSGAGDDLNSLTFRASFTDGFDDIPTATNSGVDTTAGKTDSTLYSAVNALFQLNYDASKTVTGTATNMTLSAVPTFTVKVGDMLVVGTQAKRITTVTSQTVYVIESAFTTNPTAAQATVSQAVYSKDINNFAGDGLTPASAFSSTINQIMAVYEDTSAAGDKIFDANIAPVIALTASSDGTNYTAIQTRPTLLSDTILTTDLPTAGTNLYVRLFANKISGSGTVNVLGYKVFFHRESSVQDGFLLNQAYCLTNGAGTEINIAQMAVVVGKSRIKTTFTFPVGVNAGTTNGALKVYVNGQKIPRYIGAVETPDASYKEIDQSTIELDKDYSALSLSVEIIQDVAAIDNSDTNATSVNQIQEASSESFQGFVKTSQLMNATSTVGTPAAGTFYSSIANRTAIPDLTSDLKVKMGIERIVAQQISPISNEFGPNGEPVYGLVNDDRGQVRFVGPGWFNGLDSNGTRTQSNTLNDYIEITFHGTGLNLIGFQSASLQDIRITVDGGTEGANIFPASSSAILASRNYSPNIILPAVSGLSLGTHTVKIRNAASAVFIYVGGFEITNESSSIKVQPGTSYINGKKLVSSAQQIIAYNSTFESGTLGTRGGRVIVYQKADGTIAKSVRPVNAAQANMTSADHTNEEISRTYHWREFGANRADDFSTAVGAVTNRAFTLDDGTTTLSSDAFTELLSATGNQIVPSGVNNFISLTFVGTGLDVVCGNGATDTYTITVDGVTTATGFTLTSIKKHLIVSGLTYGTHTVKLIRTTSTANGAGYIQKFIVYQPKKPTVPSGAVELADYNVVANPVANTAIAGITTGVIRKNVVRELTYVGTWAITFDPTNNINGYELYSNPANGSYTEYTFFGTGFDLRYVSNTDRGGSTQVSLQNLSTNGALLSLQNSNFSFTSSVYGVGSFAPTTGILSQTGALQYNNGFVITGLPLSLYKVRIANPSANVLSISGLDIITPIHSAKSNLNFDIQNTLPVGSQAISDNRKFSAIKDVGLQANNISQASSVALNPSTSSTSPVPMPDMSSVIVSKSGKIKISYNIQSSNNTAGGISSFRVLVNGVQVGQDKNNVFQSGGAGTSVTTSDSIVVPISPGIHKVDVYWWTNAGLHYVLNGGTRTLLVEEV